MARLQVGQLVVTRVVAVDNEDGMVCIQHPDGRTMKLWTQSHCFSPLDEPFTPAVWDNSERYKGGDEVDVTMERVAFPGETLTRQGVIEAIFNEHYAAIRLLGEISEPTAVIAFADVKPRFKAGDKVFVKDWFGSAIVDRMWPDGLVELHFIINERPVFHTFPFAALQLDRQK